MPIKSASFKHMRQTVKRTLSNQKVSSAMAKAIKQARRAITDKLPDTKAKIQAAIKIIDRTAQKGIIKKNTAARLKSRLAKALLKANK